MRAHSSEGLGGCGLSCACFDQRPRRRIPQGLIELYGLALVEGLSTLEQHGLKSGGDQLVQRLTIVRGQVGKLARALLLLNGGGDSGAQFVISRAGHRSIPMRSPTAWRPLKRMQFNLRCTG